MGTLASIGVSLALTSLAATGDAGAGLCNEHGWCWTQPVPQGNRIAAFWQSPSGALWASGAAGTVLVRREGTWRPLPHAGTQPAEDIWGCNDNDVWVAAGDLWHWDGTTWREHPAPGDSQFWDIDGRSCSEIWAVGSTPAHRGAIARWDGKAWSSVDPPLPYRRYFDVAVLADEILVATDRSNGWGERNTGLLLHHDGRDWRTEELGPFILRSLTVGDDGTLWAAVQGGNPGQTAARYYDGRWSVSDAGNVWKVASLGPGGTWAVGPDGSVSKWDDGSWHRITNAGTDPFYDFYDLATDDEGRHWIAGKKGIAATPRGTQIVAHGSGGGGTINALGYRGNELWALGEGDGHGAELSRWNGRSWQSVRLPAESRALFAWWDGGPNDLWLGGRGGQLLHYDGKGWARQTLEVRTPWRAFVGHSASDLWAIGDRGLLAHFDGKAWSLVDDVAMADLHAGVRVGNELWVVGDDGIVLRHGADGAWRTEHIAEAGALLAIHRGSDGTVRVAGEHGRIYRWTGARWVLDSTLGPGYLRDLAERTGTWWAVGDSGLWQKEPSDSDWKAIAVGTRNVLCAVQASPEGTLWVGGTSGAILRRPPEGDRR